MITVSVLIRSGAWDVFHFLKRLVRLNFSIIEFYGFIPELDCILVKRHPVRAWQLRWHRNLIRTVTGQPYHLSLERFNLGRLLYCHISLVFIEISQLELHEKVHSLLMHVFRHFQNRLIEDCLIWCVHPF